MRSTLQLRNSAQPPPAAPQFPRFARPYRALAAEPHVLDLTDLLTLQHALRFSACVRLVPGPKLALRQLHSHDLADHSTSSLCIDGHAPQSIEVSCKCYITVAWCIIYDFAQKLKLRCLRGGPTVDLSLRSAGSQPEYRHAHVAKARRATRTENLNPIACSVQPEQAGSLTSIHASTDACGHSVIAACSYFHRADRSRRACTVDGSARTIHNAAVALQGSQRTAAQQCCTQVTRRSQLSLCPSAPRRPSPCGGRIAVCTRSSASIC